MVAESRILSSVQPQVMDQLWAEGWRHFGTEFFRASLMADEGCLKRQVPLRIRLAGFDPSKSQRRTIRRNRDLEVGIAEARPEREEAALFEVHKTRFRYNVPESLEDFLGTRPASEPCRCVQLSVREEGRLVAASFLVLGERASSSVYAVFDPALSKRRLGIYTMLAEIEFAQEQGYAFYYRGYATVEGSCYDYKKEFGSVEFYDWAGHWRGIEEIPP